MSARIRTALRYVLGGLSIAALAAVGAAAGAYQILDAPEWTDPTPVPSVRPTPAPTVTPAPSRTASVGPNELIGRCAIATQTGALITPCATPGARRVIATVRQDAAKKDPCSTTALTDLVRRHDAYWLCLGAP